MVRSIRPSEFAATYALITEASHWLKQKGIQQWEAPISEEDFKKAVELGEVYVLLVDQQIAGSVTLSTHRDHYWGAGTGTALHLHRLVVGRAFKGQGLGEKLLAWSKTRVHEVGLEYLRLDCRASNDHLRKFYASHGFEFKGLGTGRVYEYALFEAKV